MFRPTLECLEQREVYSVSPLIPAILAAPSAVAGHNGDGAFAGRWINDNDPFDDHGHGSHIGGAHAAATNIAGTVRDRVLNFDRGTVSHTVIAFAAHNNGAANVDAGVASVQEELKYRSNGNSSAIWMEGNYFKQ